LLIEAAPSVAATDTNATSIDIDHNSITVAAAPT